MLDNIKTKQPSSREKRRALIRGIEEKHENPHYLTFGSGHIWQDYYIKLINGVSLKDYDEFIRALYGFNWSMIYSEEVFFKDNYLFPKGLLKTYDLSNY